MARTPIIFNNADIFVGPTPATGQHFSLGNTGINLISGLSRIQSWSIDETLDRTDIFEQGHADRVDSIFLTAPDVGFNFTYFPTDGKNERILGFTSNTLNSSFISGFLTSATDEKNYFIAISPQGTDDDYNNSQTNRSVISLGNAFISNYSLSASVGQIPTATVSLSALNVRYNTGVADKVIPAVNRNNGVPVTTWNFTVPTGTTYTGAGIPSALVPGQIVLEFPSTGALGFFLSGDNTLLLQSFNLSVPINRTDNNQFGSMYDASKPIQLPIVSTLQVDALATDIRESALSDILCNDPSYNFRIRMKMPACPGSASADAIIIDFRNAKLTNESAGLSIGNQATVSMTFSATVSAANSASSGPFFSGING